MNTIAAVPAAMGAGGAPLAWAPGARSLSIRREASMGMAIEVVAGKSDATPLPIRLSLRCDGDHGLLEPSYQHFTNTGGASFIELHKVAMTTGWKETYDAQGRRIWLCPECSGKAAA